MSWRGLRAEAADVSSAGTGREVKRMRLRYDGVCACGSVVPAGTAAGYDRAARKAVCPSCLDSAAPAAEALTPSQTGSLTSSPAGRADEASPSAEVEVEVLTGRAGGSARAEHARRAARREQRVRAAHPRLGGLILALKDDPQPTRAWQSGAVGEERVGARLDGLTGDGVLVLHDRRVPGSRANIDHLAVGPRGVFVIDAKRYVDAKVEVRRSGGPWRPVTERLVVAGRDRTRLVTALAGQAAVVQEALEDCPGLDGIPVQPVLAFVDAQLPLLGRLEIAGVPVLGPRGTAKLVRQPGPLTVRERERLHRHLAAKLPAYQQ
jgi:hypothetical protein